MGGASALFGRDVFGCNLDEVFPGGDMDHQVSSTARAPRELVRVDLPAGTNGTPGRSLAVTIHPLDGESGWLLFLHDVALGAGGAAALRRPATPVPAPEVPALIDAASEVFRLDPTRYLDSPTGDVRRAFPALVGTSEPVLVRGEVGTGHAHVARALHYQSAPGRPLVEVGCRGRSPGALEAELFGVRGTSRTSDGGLAGSAAGGTLLVHDIDLLSRPAQELLSAAIAADGGPRLIATTARRTLAAARLEPVLCRRLEANLLELSPVRERRDQLESLVRGIARRCGATGVSAEVLAMLAHRDWPGNLVELVSRAARAAGEERIEQDDLPRDWVAAAQPPSELSAVEEIDGPPPPWVVTEDDPVSFEVYERKAILRALDHCEGDRIAAARLLGIGKSTIYRKIGELGIGESGIDDSRIEVDPARANG